MLSDVFAPSNIPCLIPSLLTVITCPWLFFRFAQKGWRRVGFSMIFVLTLSDFLYSSTVLATIFYPYVDMSSYYRLSFYFCSNFSIYWASAIAFLVYKTLKSKDTPNIKKLFIKTLLIALTISIVSVIL